MADDGTTELTVRLPTDLLRRVGRAAPAATMDELLGDALEGLLAAAAAASDPPSDPADGVRMAVGDAAPVLERLAAVVAGLKVIDERTRRLEVWSKTALAELFVHTTPFPDAAQERERREAAAERLERVDRNVRWYVERHRGADGVGDAMPPDG